jgi:hypothetical protein
VGSNAQDAMMVSHLLFADDTLIFCDPIADQFQDLRCLLLYFEGVSGLRVNLSKSKIVPEKLNGLLILTSVCEQCATK